MKFQKNFVVGLVAVAALVVLTVLGGYSTAVAAPVAVDIKASADTTLYTGAGDYSQAYHAIWTIDSRRRSLVQFDLPADAIGKIITKADLELEIERLDWTGTKVNVHRVKTAWGANEGAGAAGENPCTVATGGATYNETACSGDGSNAWPGGAGALGDVGGVAAVLEINIDTDAATGGDGGTGWFASGNRGTFRTVDIKNIAQQWANGMGQHGIMLNDSGLTNPNGSGTGQAGYWSLQHDNDTWGAGAQAATLHLEYVPEPCSVMLFGFGLLLTCLYRSRR